MTIYTKSGDNGTSFIIGKDEISKSDPTFEVFGTLDEMNSVLGFVISDSRFSSEAKNFLSDIQSNLFKIGSLIGASNLPDSYLWLKNKTLRLEDKIDDMEEKLPDLNKFILPGGSKEASKIHMARSVCRRLERVVVSFYENQKIEKQDFVLMYINRLSDFLFCLARYINFKLDYDETTWKN